MSWANSSVPPLLATLAEALLSQVNAYFQQARRLLVGSEPQEEEPSTDDQSLP